MILWQLAWVNCILNPRAILIGLGRGSLGQFGPRIKIFIAPEIILTLTRKSWSKNFIRKINPSNFGIRFKQKTKTNDIKIMQRHCLFKNHSNETNFIVPHKMRTLPNALKCLSCFCLFVLIGKIYQFGGTFWSNNRNFLDQKELLD